VSVLSRSNHAFFFDGVSDSIIVPDGPFILGKRDSLGNTSVKEFLDDDNADPQLSITSGLYSNELTIEAWLMPDCGGTVVEKSGQFKLTVGNVDTPGPATFGIYLNNGSSDEYHEISTGNKTATRYEGTVYPASEFGGIHESYNRFDTSTYGTATDLNRNHRQLLHVIATFREKGLELYVNGQIMASKSLKDVPRTIAKSNSNIYIGGKGGQFRGVMEAIHIKGGFKQGMTHGKSPLKDDTTMLLYRFEEPISPIEKEYAFTSITNDFNDAGLSTISISASDAQAIATLLTGKAADLSNFPNGNLDFTVTPYSSGKYTVVHPTSGNKYIPHVPYNLLINPNSIDRKTRKPNQTPPERVRLHSIDSMFGAATLTVSSVHLDHDRGVANDGLMGVLNKSRTTDSDDYFVIISADLLIDSGTGRPYQPPHFSTQIIDRTGQMVIDESNYERHGLVYSSRMATSTVDTDNPFAPVWYSSVPSEFQIGHSGRHVKNHVDGHPFLRMLPDANEEIVDLKGDGQADLIDIIYDQMQDGVEHQISVNSRVDVFRDLNDLPINSITNTTTVTQVVNTYQDTGSPPTGKRKLLAIGGPQMDFRPFALKGPVPLVGEEYASDIRKHHLRPSSQSRVALLHVPQLSTSNIKFAPYVEIHYNAMDLTGASMYKPVTAGSFVSGQTYIIVSIGDTNFTTIGASANTVGLIFEATGTGSGTGTARPYHPMLMVEKTVPASDVSIGAGSYVYDAIADSISSGKTLYAAGGVIDFDVGKLQTNSNMLQPHNLIGDNSEGYAADSDVDETSSPANYTPRESDSSENKTPSVILDSTSSGRSHESVFNKVRLSKPGHKHSLNDIGDYSRVEPQTVPGSPSTGEFDTGITTSHSHVHEVFDIIDNVPLVNDSISNMSLILQPSDRSRTNQLSRAKSLLDSFDTPSQFKIMCMMSRARVRSIKENDAADKGNYTVVHCVGLSESAASRNVDFVGTGSPDSHIVKEIEPNAPVVTVTLGGPGQGAMDTKPLYHKSKLAHESYSTRRAYAVEAVKLEMDFLSGTGTLHIRPLNNNSDDLASWGTYGFPRYGSIYMPDGSSAKYSSKTGTSFSFVASSLGSGDYLSSSGSEYTTIAQLLNAIGLMAGSTSGVVEIYGNFTIYSEPDFGDESNIENGTTVNDKMHQSLNDVQHDYQLGTQYASTRALVEIPLFANQFFKSTIGPDNGFKIHLDATHTAHTYNPSPVGRRPKGTSPADREAESAYSFAMANRQYVSSSTVKKWTDTRTVKRLYVSNISIFPDSSTSTDTYQGITNAFRYRKINLANGEYAYYTNVNTSNGYLDILNTEYGYSPEFFDSLEAGITVFLNESRLNKELPPMFSDSISQSSDFENRSEYYHDSASVKTQGGNVDYGLRQYVTAVEFKAGPESNPHAPRVGPRRATGKVLSELKTSLGNDEFALTLTLSPDEFSTFPNLGYDTLSEAPLEAGELIYEVQYDDSGTIHRYHYHGNLKTVGSLTTPENSITLTYTTTGGFTSYPVSILNKRITLSRKASRVLRETSAFGTGYTYYEGGTVYRELFNNMNIDTTIAIQQNDSSSNPESLIQLTMPSNRTLHDLHNISVKKDDEVYYYVDTTTDELRKIGTVTRVVSGEGSNNTTIHLSANAPTIPASAKLAVAMGDYEDKDAILNAHWLNPYAPGGLRNGDTIWANMSYNNPHAVEGLFAKSRGVYNESQVWTEFNGGTGSLNNSPRDSIPIENFMIGKTCLETARNYVQHVNRTIEENYLALGLTASQAPTVAFVDPYLSTPTHARVLLYDTAHDREFVAFQDIFMQVQTSPETTQLGWRKEVVEGSARKPLHKVNAQYAGSGPSPWTTQIDVTNGYPSQNPFIRSTQQSKFIESAYAHDLANRQSSDLLGSTVPTGSYTLPTDGRSSTSVRIYGKAHGHHVHTEYSLGGTLSNIRLGNSTVPRTNDSVVLHKVADELHFLGRKPAGTNVDVFTKELIKLREGTTGATFRDPSTFFDTPDGTRVIPAFLCLRGIRAESLDLTSHEEGRLQHLPEWKDMDFVRRLTVDMGVVKNKEGVVNITKAAEEVVRLINQHGALTARTENGSAHDPSPFWHVDDKNKGTHMGYLRAHIGREVRDLNGDIGVSVVIHSTVPGATGRNFCVWLDNSTGQDTYQPEFMIGHGGRWRNFWALPEETEGELMHPAPMPLNKHGRPFAPITTLQQYITSEESGEDVQSVADFEDDSVLRAVSDSISGKSHNSINAESLDVKGSSSTFVKGLRTGSRAMARINFGGLVASGVPGWAPNAGKWGFGKVNDSSFDNRYGESTSTSYGSYVPAADILPDNVGTSNIYGFRFKDNVGTEHGVRYIYRRDGDSFSNENTVLPTTIEEEVCVFFDDRDVAQGGFTIGNSMQGDNDATGRMDFTFVSETLGNKWKGARWRGVSAPNAATLVTASVSSTTMTIAFQAPFDTSFTDDKLGYLGFPRENGIIQITDEDGDGDADVGLTLSYGSRSGTQFFDVLGLPGSWTSGDYLITSVLNWTCLVTDELIAAATAAAINAGNEINNPDGLKFDCRDMYATDGRTFGEWGVREDAITIRAFNPSKNVAPLNESFSATLHRDFGIHAAHLEFGELKKTVRPTGAASWNFDTSRALTDAVIDGSRNVDCGYLPFNILKIDSVARGPHANTATPLFVDSKNNKASTKEWARGLKGLSFTRTSGDHILPKIDNPLTRYETAWTAISELVTDGEFSEGFTGAIAVDTGNPTNEIVVGDLIADNADRVLGRVTARTSTSITLDSLRVSIADNLIINKRQSLDNSTKNWQSSVTLSASMFHFAIPAGQVTGSIIKSLGERKRVYLSPSASVVAESKVGTSSDTVLQWDIDNSIGNMPREITFNRNLLSTHTNPDFDGLRSVGSVFSEPIVMFRGGRSSKDHSVPLFFGGGFSGVTLDVNDGTQNDYSSFYTHPYANGPTGVAGIQNANEISTSFAMLDANAMFAFFPGAALCNQHRGSITPPAFNKDNVLAPDLHSTTTLASDVVTAKPVPLVLRFPHPTARYEDHLDGTENKTTYLVFGPGQAFPFTREAADGTGLGHSSADTGNRFEPNPGLIVTATNNSTWASVPDSDGQSNLLFPNSIDNDNYAFGPLTKTRYNDTAGFHWRAMVNWETPAGYCMKGKFLQRPSHGRHYGQQFSDATPYNVIHLLPIHPKMHTPVIAYGIAMAADTVWHMDGGFHPGGHWMDNQITFNPPHPSASSRINGTSWPRADQIHPAAFRVSGAMLSKTLDYIGSSDTVTTNDSKMEYIVVDATRAQNGEELATVLGAAINAFPGGGALKALGGTHMPSMGNSLRQDRYGWVSVGTSSNGVQQATSVSPNQITNFITVDTGNPNQVTAEQVPASGWLRAHVGNAVSWACYHSREINASGDITFLLAPNRIEGKSEFEDKETWEDHANGSADDFAAVASNATIFVWSKAGTIRFNNENDSTRDHMTQVHFSGIADAIDRTKPIGAVGWHGERYSHLNSLKISVSTVKNGATSTTTGYAAGLGAYHPSLAFSPYGTAGTVMSVHSSVPVVAPMKHSPESVSPVDGIGTNVAEALTKSRFYVNFPDANGDGWSTGTLTPYFQDSDITTGSVTHWSSPTNYTTTLPEELTHPQGVYTSAFLVVSYECETALKNKYDRDLIQCNGDWLHLKTTSTNKIRSAGTSQFDPRIHNQDRFTAPANAGPNVEALIVSGTSVPTGDESVANWSDSVTWSFFTAFSDKTDKDNDLSMKNAIPGLNKTGDLLFDLDQSIGSALLQTGDAKRNVSSDKYTGTAYTASTGNSVSYPTEYWMGDVNAFQMYENSPVKNFTVENVVWKRMDGGNLSLPAINARGLGAVPWVTRVDTTGSSDVSYLTGEKVYGNVRFSFETTNSAMMPVLQAQELAHPEFIKKVPYSVGGVLEIPNEEVQFQSISVIDDSGQEHVLEGGSPLGTVIRGFRTPPDRGVNGKAPALANSGNTPNLKVMLPNPDSIPGNLIVRSGFDPIQAYQNETMGSGGMIHPDLSETHIGHLFDNSVAGPRNSPTYEDHNWERIDPVTFDSEVGGWNNNNPLKSSYELHDRTLFFHVTKMGHTHTHRYPTVYDYSSGSSGACSLQNQTVSVTAWNSTSSQLTVSQTLDSSVFSGGFGTKEVMDDRRFLRVYNPTTDEGAVCSYTTAGSTTITVVGDVGFADFMLAQTVTDLKVVPSYYVPAGSTRFFAARRMRDHAEVSGNSPDMAHTRYFAGDTVAYNAYSKPKMTPMPYPRMGHHFVTPTMPMLPGHWAHPAYQSLYRRHLVDFNASVSFKDTDLLNKYKTPTNSLSDIETAQSITFVDNINPLEAEVNFSGVNAAPSGPSDIHGGAFTLMFETGVKYDGYGILASSGTAGTMNSLGGHTIILEASANYTLEKHFPDPAEVGAYQIVIQPNVFSNQLIGYHNNATVGLTSQQVNTVVGIKRDSSRSTKIGGLGLILAKEVQADVRGCEVFINEMMLDVSPDYGSQFTNIPPLMSYNPLGVQLTESPSFTRRGFPYAVMFSDATPGYTLNIPWWSILHKNGPQGTDATNYRGLSQYGPDDYYLFSRSTFGSVGNQLTINGYTSTYIDIYSSIRENISINPKSTVVSFSSASGKIQISNSNTFPISPYYSQVVEYTGKNGNRYTKTLQSRSGALFDVNQGDYLQLQAGSDEFWTNLYDGAVVRLSYKYDTLPAGDIFTNEERSVFAHILPDIVDGNQDTNNAFLPDAYMCMWHPNLGRPNTYFSDSRTTLTSSAIDKDSYNSLPEHFETIHYHDFSHVISTGPFDFLIKTPKSTRTGEVTSGDSSHDAGGTNVMLSGFWPCGSRGGAHASRLDVYSYASSTWNLHATTDNCNFSSASNKEWTDADDDGSYSLSNGLAVGSMGGTRRRPYGYRNAVRQANNKPRYGVNPVRFQHEETANTEGNNTLDYDAGPLVQIETSDWGWSGNGTDDDTFPTTYVGVMERLTNFTGMLGHDQANVQVRYSDGRRMTRPFGTPVRTLRNPSGVERDWWGDSEGKGETSLSVASQYYLVDWWGNERGEDVRRAPVRGFGIRPAWDCGNAYEEDRTNTAGADNPSNTVTITSFNSLERDTASTAQITISGDITNYVSPANATASIAIANSNGLNTDVFPVGESAQIKFGLQPADSDNTDANNFIQLVSEDGAQTTKWFARTSGTNGAALSGNNGQFTYPSGARQYNIGASVVLTARNFKGAVETYSQGFAGSLSQPQQVVSDVLGADDTQNITLTAAPTGSAPNRVGATSATLTLGSSFASHNTNNPNTIAVVDFTGGINELILGETTGSNDNTINYFTITDSASNVKNYFPSHDSTNQPTGSTGTRTFDDGSTKSVVYFNFASNGNNGAAGLALVQAINGSSGHPNTISAQNNGSGSVGLTHDLAGTAGNGAALAKSNIADSVATISGSNFSGGVTEENATNTPFIQIIDNESSPTTKKYVPVKNGDALGNGNNGGGSIGDVTGGIAFQEGASAVATADNLRIAIGHSNGHDGTVLTDAAGSAAITLTQKTIGANTAAITLNNLASNISKTNFSGGGIRDNFLGLTDAAGTLKKYKASNTAANGSTDGTYVFYDAAAPSQNSTVAENLETAINSVNGHNGTLTTTRTNNAIEVRLNQATVGSAAVSDNVTGLTTDVSFTSVVHQPRTPYRRIWNDAKPIYNLKGIADLSSGNISVTAGNTIPRFGGVLNDTNNNDTSNLVDVFAPTHSLRVGDMGNGRGVRYPTAFNEDVVTELSSPTHTTGMVLSHNTAEPPFGNGLMRPRNDVLESDEVPRGISARLGISENGLLKPDAVVSDRVEEVVGSSVHKDAVSRTSPRIGIDADTVEGIEQHHVVINTEAHSLHTDRDIGQRVLLQGGSQVKTSSASTLTDVNYNALSFARQSSSGSVVSAAHKFSHTSTFRPYGGTYLIDSKSYSGLFDDTGWGVTSLTGSTDTSNPYQDPDNYSSDTVRNNEKDKSVEFLLRPIRVLDNSHVEVFRFHNSLSSGTPQYDANYYYCTSGGRYGLYTYKVASGRTPAANTPASRATPDGNGPYIPVYVMTPGNSLDVPTSQGPNIPGVGVTGFDNTNLESTVSRLVISENTIQHHRSDAPRRKQEQESDDKLRRVDYEVKARFSQSLHGKGHDGDVAFSVTEHSGDGS